MPEKPHFDEMPGVTRPTIAEIPFGMEVYNLTLRFREEHLRKPLGLSQSAADVEGEETQIHIAATDGDAVVGTLVLKPVSPENAKLRQMAVSPRFRGSGLGRDIVVFAERLAADRGFRTIEMAARSSARGFYEKLGYQIVGDEFVEVTVPHFRMRKSIHD